MFPTTKKVQLGDKEILCMDLTYGYIVGLENGSIVETKHDVIVNATDLDEDAVLGLRRHEVEELYNTINFLTYPTLHNEDGTLKDMSELGDIVEDKKKA